MVLTDPHADAPDSLLSPPESLPLDSPRPPPQDRHEGCPAKRLAGWGDTEPATCLFPNWAIPTSERPCNRILCARSPRAFGQPQPHEEIVQRRTSTGSFKQVARLVCLLELAPQAVVLAPM